MNNKFWLIIAGVLGVAVLAMGWFLGVSPKLNEMNNANAQRSTVEAQNRLQEARIVHLKSEFQNIDSLKADLASAQLGLPPGDELSTFLGQLHQLEASSGVVLQTFAASDAQSYVPAAGMKSPSPLVTARNFVAVTIDLTVKGNRPQVIDFVHDLQFGKRLFLVTKLTVAQDTTDPNLYQGSITGFVYVLIDPSSPPPTPTPVGSLDTAPTPSPTANASK